MKFWFSTLYVALFLVFGTAAGVEIWHEYGGRGTSSDQVITILLFGVALGLSTVACVYFRAQRKAPQLLWLAGWTSSLMGKFLG